MTQKTPGTDAGEPSAGAKPHHGKVVASSDDEFLTDKGSQEKPPVADEKRGGT